MLKKNFFVDYTQTRPAGGDKETLHGDPITGRLSTV